jgi:hypothetical protein
MVAAAVEPNHGIFDVSAVETSDTRRPGQNRLIDCVRALFRHHQSAASITDHGKPT